MTENSNLKKSVHEIEARLGRVRVFLQICAVVAAVVAVLLSIFQVSQKNEVGGLKDLQSLLESEVQRLRANVAESVNKIDEALLNAQRASAQTEMLMDRTDETFENSRKVLEGLKKNIEALTTESVSKRLDEIEARVKKVRDQMNTFLDEKTVTLFMNAKSMAAEIEAREAFQERTKTHVDSKISVADEAIENLKERVIRVSDTVDGLESEQRNLLYWILGGMATILAAVIGAAFYLSRFIRVQLKLPEDGPPIAGDS